MKKWSFALFYWALSISVFFSPQTLPPANFYYFLFYFYVRFLAFSHFLYVFGHLPGGGGSACKSVNGHGEEFPDRKKRELKKAQKPVGAAFLRCGVHKPLDIIRSDLLYLKITKKTQFELIADASSWYIRQQVIPQCCLCPMFIHSLHLYYNPTVSLYIVKCCTNC